MDQKPELFALDGKFKVAILEYLKQNSIGKPIVANTSTPTNRHKPNRPEFVKFGFQQTVETLWAVEFSPLPFAKR